MWTAIDNYWRTASQQCELHHSHSYPSTPHEEEDKPTTADRLFHTVMAQFTAGLSPASLAMAYADWILHLSQSPGKQGILIEKAVRKTIRIGLYAMRNLTENECEHCIQPLIHDQRFRAQEWQTFPFCLIYQNFLLIQQWWHNATTGVAGMSAHHEQVISFAARQLLDIVSPVNFIATNPEVLNTIANEKGMNLVRGAQYWIEDVERTLGGHAPLGVEHFRPGKEIAITPGRVVFRNHLIELIQYAPQTPEVYEQPIFIVPAWIMKYYILDLSPHNSLVNYLVGRGHTVYMISWRNPSAEDRDLGMDDYLNLGVLTALAEIIKRESVNVKIQAVGYCLGGTLLAIAAASLAQQQNKNISSLTMLAAQTDFIEAGELRLFIDESQLDYLDDMMWNQGYLDTRQMAGTFQLLRSNDLIWSRLVNLYLLGKRETMTDLMAWNADATRMPFRMQSDYLRQLFLNNDLFEGRFKINDQTIALSDIQLPTFLVATETDHVAPWRSVYKLNGAISGDVTFLLTSGGHNAGITSEPGHARRHYKIGLCRHADNYSDADAWLQLAHSVEGSWWPAWAEWLEHGQTKHAATQIAEPFMQGLPVAPGEYVLQK